MKLELKHLAGYLPYDTGVSVRGINGKLSISLIDHYKLEEIKPILRPLSNLTKEIEVNGEKFVPNIKLEWNDGNNINYDDILDWVSVAHYQKLLEWHFDIYGLIENDLAIDINTLEK